MSDLTRREMLQTLGTAMVGSMFLGPSSLAAGKTKRPAGPLPAGGKMAGDDPIIRIQGDQIILANDVGAKLAIFHQTGQYGLGTFYIDDVALGLPIESFLGEDNVGNNSRDTFQRLWPGTWLPGFRATTYEILQNDQSRGVIKFAGKDANPTGSVTITLERGGFGYRLDFEVLPFKSIKHPLYVSGPFYPDRMEFIQFPFENPIIPPFRGHWTIQPTRSTVPMMFGCEKIDGRDYYVGIGYRLDQDYPRGAIEYDAAESAPFKLHYISPDDSGWLGRPRPGEAPEPYRLGVVISAAATQYDCVNGYRLQSGYDISTPIRRGLDESLSGIMKMYQESSAYVSLPPFKHKAYHQQINPDTGKPPEKGYGAYIPIGVNVQLAYQFFRYWQAHPNETWAKERAIEMANFFVETQAEAGAVPTLWDPKQRRFRAYQSPMDKEGYIYATCQQAMGAYCLHRLYLARKATEGVSVDTWRNAAVRAIDDIIRKIRSDGFLGRSYDAKGNYDTACAPDWPLIALDYFAAQSGDAKYDEARVRLENWTYSTFIRTNHWFNWSSDNAGWRLPSAPPLDVDSLNSLSLATYSVFRHMRTGDPKYVDWAKQIISYNWLIAIPTQFAGFQHVTKGLVREQDFYTTSDLPFRTSLFIDCFPYLSAFTGDRFFIDFYKLMIQTQMAYQNIPPRMQAFNIGLAWDASGANPADAVGEPDVNYIVEFCSMFLESVTSQNAYRYVGGPGWGQGLDYEPSFASKLVLGTPYVVSSSSRLTDITWISTTSTLRASLAGNAGEQGTLAIGWEPTMGLGQSPRVFIAGKAVPQVKCRCESKHGGNLLYIPYTLERDTLSLEIEISA